MKTTAKTLYEFWSGFTIPAYPEYTVPDDAELPYITYELKEPVWSSMAFYTARVWYRDTSMVSIAEKIDEISRAIGEGIRIKSESGDSLLWLFKDDEFVQMQPMEAESIDIKVAYLSMILHVLK